MISWRTADNYAKNPHVISVSLNDFLDKEMFMKRLYQLSIAEPAGMYLSWLEASKKDFLMKQLLISHSIVPPNSKN